MVQDGEGSLRFQTMDDDAVAGGSVSACVTLTFKKEFDFTLVPVYADG